MLLNLNDTIFAQVPKTSAGFVSSFPSTDATYSAKYDALKTMAASANAVDPKTDLLMPTLGEILLVQQQGQAWRDGAAMVNAFKSWTVGDLLTDWLPDLVRVTKGDGVLGGAVEGLFAAVAFPQSSDPIQIARAIGKVALDVALGAIQAVPIVGQVIGAVVAVAQFLVRLYSAPEQTKVPLMLPWERYSNPLNETLVRDFVLSAAKGVRWTQLWMPPYDLEPWTLVGGVDAQTNNPIPGGQVFAPERNGTIPFAKGLGAIPNTLKTAAHLQRILADGPDTPALQRYFGDPYMPIGWGNLVTDVGSFFPDVSQICGGMWQQVCRPGNPDMYKVNATKLQSAWADYFGLMFTSAWSRYLKDPSVGELLAPYIAIVFKHDGGDDVRLGIPNMRRPHPAPFVTPTIFTSGPGKPGTRTPCLWVEEDTVRRTDVWPYDRDVGDHKAVYPAQHPDYVFRSGVYLDDDGGAQYGPNLWKATRSGTVGQTPIPKGQKVPKGYRCVPWPTPVEMLTGYAMPDVAITTPACQQLRKLQARCLSQTLVCAYVRPDDVQGLQRYEAFDDPTLRDLCREMRLALLANDARFGVNLKDVDDLDPVFAQALRASGVNNSPAQRAKALQLKLAGAGAGVKPEDSEPLPSALPPAGGVAFDDIAPPARQGREGSGGGVAIAATLTALGLGYALTR